MATITHSSGADLIIAAHALKAEFRIKLSRASGRLETK